jgi:heme exporter protein D
MHALGVAPLVWGAIALTTMVVEILWIRTTQQRA